MKFGKRKTIYLDNSGGTPISKKAYKVLSKTERSLFGNASAIYKSGLQASRVLEDSREKIASLINAHSDEIIFTTSGTESDALAIFGVVCEFNKNNPESKPHIITTNIEHPAVLENCHILEERGLASVSYVPVEKTGLVDPKKIKEEIKDNTILISVMYANNEIGTVEPILEIAKEIRHYRKTNENKYSLIYPLFHTDACQAMNYLFVENIEKLGVDLMTFNGSKVYGPKGTGVLFKKRNVKLTPIYGGGGQEFGLRPGTENVPAFASLAKALEEVFKIKKNEVERLSELRDYAISEILKLDILPFRVELNGDPKERLPNNINLSIFGLSSELLVVELDACGIEVSEKSACHSADNNSSYVIKAIRGICSRKKNEVVGSLRISMGQKTTKKDIDELIKTLYKIFKKYKEWYNKPYGN